MNRKFFKQIVKNMESKNTEELIKIWKENDSTQYSKEAFKAIKQIFKERGVQLPRQLLINEKYNSKKETFICSNCGRFISEYDFMSHDGLCKYCRGMPMQRGFPSPPGFPKL